MRYSSYAHCNTRYNRTPYESKYVTQLERKEVDYGGISVPVGFGDMSDLGEAVSIVLGKILLTIPNNVPILAFNIRYCQNTKFEWRPFFKDGVNSEVIRGVVFQIATFYDSLIT